MIFTNEGCEYPIAADLEGGGTVSVPHDDQVVASIDGSDSTDLLTLDRRARGTITVSTGSAGSWFVGRASAIE